ncbi:MAG TPA: hypothetical protein VFF42_08560 [Candidatus Eremiobacteraceae bacterium]|nr:hypothetical protein [Candidatus Eremiobacteraceae bacterium]
MNATKQFAGIPGRIVWIAEALLTFLCFLSTPAWCSSTPDDRLPYSAMPAVTNSSAVLDDQRLGALPGKVTHCATDREGDHSLNVVTMVEQAVSGYAQYTIRLQLASGAEQVFALAAPPGGLQPEMRDMSGDHIANDLVLVPSLFLSPPTVLLNDGLNHFELAVWSFFPGLLRGDHATRQHALHDDAAFASSGFKSRPLITVEGFLAPQQSQKTPVFTLANVSSTSSQGLPHSGRAPPSLPN